ncbi:hypothetical protein PP175_05455 [Aneurinibacillus sp. Ricciae_BoGa-3]|uniref:hypothetical protein n=1 Tax=Aneurinibacillus sp. Ricciae_BoGa-3 TaxID=3022697 RepID=UPI0023412FCA|nr:hypothetical protein [Aneurinibacillus sp. Ricciae_BoGa-3]WCK55399.1 hypothetical protein PP175_05455 [Aneurinibacillus sp. Ricciae_BoGa-3]
MLDCTKVKTYTPIIAEMTGPTCINANDAMAEIIGHMNDSFSHLNQSLRGLDKEQFELVQKFIVDSLQINDWMNDEYVMFDIYRLRVETMQQWQLDQMPDFEGY